MKQNGESGKGGRNIFAKRKRINSGKKNIVRWSIGTILGRNWGEVGRRARVLIVVSNKNPGSSPDHLKLKLVRSPLFKPFTRLLLGSGLGSHPCS